MVGVVRRLAKWFVGLFFGGTDPGYLFDDYTFWDCFATPGVEISRRGSTVICRSRQDFMFHVVDVCAEGGPELVGEYAIYRNAVIAAELWEYSKRKKTEAVPVLRVGSGSP